MVSILGVYFTMSLLYEHVKMSAITTQDMDLRNINNSIVFLFKYKNCKHFLHFHEWIEVTCKELYFDTVSSNKKTYNNCTLLGMIDI
jgi:hypothetical protein